MIVDDEVRALITELECSVDLPASRVLQITEQLIRHVFDNCQLPTVQQRYASYFQHDFSSVDPASQISTYPLDDAGYAVALDPLTQEQQIWDYWVRFGVTITANVVGSEQLNLAVARISEIAAALSDGKFDIDDAATHEFMPKDATGNCLISRGFMDVYQDDMLTQLRQAVRVWLHLVIIWGRPDLWTTYDRLGTKLAGHPESKGLPLHVDQNPTVDPGFITVQGVLALSDCAEERGTLVTVPGSRAFFPKYADIVVTQRPGYRGEYVELDLKQDFAKVLQGGYQVIPMRAGSFATWDSRTTHANSPNKSLLARRVAYISAGPAKEYDEVAVRARMQALESGVGVNNRRANLHATTKPRYSNHAALDAIRRPAQFSPLGMLLHNQREYHEVLDTSTHPLFLKMKVLLSAEGFGYGPAATIATLFPEIRKHFQHVALIGNGHTLDLLTAGYDAIYPIDQEAESKLIEIISQYELFITVSDYKLAQLAVKARVPTVIIDQLAWFWKEIPLVLQQPEVLYLPQNFMGVEERIAQNPSNYALYKIVAPILAQQPEQKPISRDTVLINLGGLSNPFWTEKETTEFAQCVCKAIRKIIPSDVKIAIAANRQLTESKQLPELQDAKTYTRSEMLELLPRVKLAFMTSGLGNIFEAAAHNIPTIYLPPANDSQAKQARAMQAEGFSDYLVKWQDLGLTLDYDDEQRYVMAAISLAVATVVQRIELQDALAALFKHAYEQAILQSDTNALKLLARYGTNGISQVTNAIVAFARAPRIPRFAQRTIMSLALYPNTQLEVITDSEMLTFTISDYQTLQAHLPGVRSEKLTSPSQTIRLSHKQTYAEPITLKQAAYAIDIAANFGSKIPEDLIHLMHGIMRANWLRQNLCVVHAACVGVDSNKHVLLIGPAGSGKTSTALNCILGADAQGFTLFSGDKTIIEFVDRKMFARAGTKSMTLRSADRARWPQISKGEYRNDRFVFQLEPEQYSAESVEICAIFMLKLDDREKSVRLSHASSVHTLYPLFLDMERSDIQLGVDQAIFDGSIPLENKLAINRGLAASLRGIATYQLTGSLVQVTEHIRNVLSPKPVLLTSYAASILAIKSPSASITKTYLFGICGLGHGHIFRQLPIIEALLSVGHKVVIFAYGNALEYFNNKYSMRCVVLEVCDRFLIGNTQGLDFAASAAAASSANESRINFTAMSRALQHGPYELVISDYEEVAAQFARMQNIPLVTIDQQSKYLLGGFPPELADTSCVDEVQRLSAFFPDAYARIAFSFFKVSPVAPKYDVTILAPILRSEILGLRDKPLASQKTILIYMSALYTLDLAALAAMLQQFPETRFEVFIPAKFNTLRNTFNVKFHNTDIAEFFSTLASCHGVIATAGHMLLSEAMYLSKPVLAIPARMFEQQMNAKVIAENRFGMLCEESALNVSVIREFLLNLDVFAQNIRTNDSGILLGATDSATLLAILDKVKLASQEPRRTGDRRLLLV